MTHARFEKKVAVITGGGGDIGKAIALEFAREGADVIISDITDNNEKLAALRADISKFGGTCEVIKTDVSNQEDVIHMVQRVRDTHEGIDILINCAGVWIPGQTLLECPEENWDRVLDINLKGCWLCCKEVGKVMAARRNGVIINMSSQVGITPGTGAGAYSISKAGIIMLTRQLALELGQWNIRVNALAPGVVKTRFNENIWKDPKIAEHLSTTIPLGRMAEPEDIAGAALFLASGESRYITGDILTVNGGWQPGG